jgi:hypothetical protein
MQIPAEERDLRAEQISYSPEKVSRVTEEITQACLRAGIDDEDARAIAKQIAVWLSRQKKVELPARGWMSSRVKSFLRRYWKYRYRRDLHPELGDPNADLAEPLEDEPGPLAG